MSYRNPLMNAFPVPRDPEVAARIDGFYNEIGWSALRGTGSALKGIESGSITYVHPIMPNESSLAIPPTIAYRQTSDPEKVEAFVNHQADTPSPYARGLRLPTLQQLVEIYLAVPSDDTVHDIFDRGGPVLAAHTHILPREHAGRQEFCFGDPFNFSFRVTTDPGWEIRPQRHLTTKQEELEKLTTMVHSPDINERIEIITHANFRKTAELFFDSTHIGERLKRLLNPDHREYFQEFLYYDESGKPKGVKKDQLGPLIKLIKEKGMTNNNSMNNIRGLGVRSVELMRLLHAQLFPDQPLNLDDET
jgi:hypothetical protein